MIQSILILVAGLVLVLIGAEALVSGASGIARKFGVSQFVIGLTIVALGTSAPEMVVSFISAFEGNSTLAVGNIVGSNIFNTALILGLTAIILPISITKDNIKKDIPFNIVVTLLLVILGMSCTLFHIGNNILSRIDGAIFLILFVWYLISSFKNSPHECTDDEEEAKSLFVSIVLTVGGLAALIFGGNWFVNGAKEVAVLAGLSDKFIAITILAGGTSMPELATSVVAALKGKDQMALGNILGSNTFNILLILGGSAIINPIKMDGISWVDLGMVLLCSVVVFICAYTNKKDKIDRLEGLILLAMEVAYMIYLFKAM